MGVEWVDAPPAGPHRAQLVAAEGNTLKCASCGVTVMTFLAGTAAAAADPRPVAGGDECGIPGCTSPGCRPQ